MTKKTNFQKILVIDKKLIYNFLMSARLIGDACTSFNDNCVEGLEPNYANITDNLNNSLMLVTALNTKIGYDNSATIAKKAHKEGTTLKQAAMELGFLTEKEYDQWVKPEKMTKGL